LAKKISLGLATKGRAHFNMVIYRVVHLTWFFFFQRYRFPGHEGMIFWGTSVNPALHQFDCVEINESNSEAVDTDEEAINQATSSSSVMLLVGDLVQINESSADAPFVISSILR
jgi:hypothetical protein